MEEQDLLEMRAKVLLDRLERLSADSRFAHQASGVRGSLIQLLRTEKHGGNENSLTVLKARIKLGEKILKRAAAEIPES